MVKAKLSKISSKRQITLPKSFLDKLNLSPEQFVQIVIHNDIIEICNPRKSIKSKLQKLIHSVEPKIKTEKSIEDQINEAKQNHFLKKEI
jgi:bifunctional DNA-binding transcriptional regulator/antitoxin component of YhaV-PrlF toxin-antitoxin module